MIDYSKILNQHIQSIPPSGIRNFFDIVTKRKDSISLGIGEPDFITPQHICNAGIRSLEKGYTNYTANAGMAELRHSISKYLDRRFGLTYNPHYEVLVTVGGSEAIDLAIRALIGPGDEVLVPEPNFVCYTPCVTLAGGKAIPVVTCESDAFCLTAEALRAAITPHTKLLILSYPNNPTGSIMRRENLEKIADVLRGTNILILSDEIYAELTYDTVHVSIASIPDMRERTILVSGFSKAYAMTGWRLGYACGPASILSAMTKIHQYTIMCPPTLSQYAAIEALENGDADIEAMRKEYNQRRILMTDGFRQIGLSCFEPCGAFYIFPSIKRTGLSSTAFAELLLAEENVAVIPGCAFGKSGEGYVRCSYSCSVQNIKEALTRITRFVRKRI